MNLGKYTKNKIDYSKYLVTKCPFTLFSSVYQNVYGCGAMALASIIGGSPSEYSKSNRYRSHYSDCFMLRQLKKARITVIPITAASVTNSEYVEETITKNHILLSSILLSKQQASWVLIYNNYVLHNSEINPLKALNFINYPPLTSYVLFKESWK